MNRAASITLDRTELATLYFAIIDQKEKLADDDIESKHHYENIQSKLNSLICFSEIEQNVRHK